MYSEYVLKMAPRVLTQVDRDKHSKNYGDCDRNHWHLKIRDFSSAILQQTGLALALLYTVDFPENRFYQKDVVREWAISTVYYWKSIQLKDGSFNEYYPHEHGFPPTAFSLYAMCEVYKRLDMQDENILQAFEKSAGYLSAHVEKKAYNQELASITALYSAYTVLQKDWILEGLNKKLERILALQSKEGWFPEYGGADIGCLSVSLDMLAEYYWMSHDEKVLEPLNKMTAFLKYFVHPDVSVGGEYASRNTIYFLPNGLQVMSNLGNQDAAAMLQFLYRNCEKDFYFLDAADDRYFSHYLLHSFLRAIEKAKQEESKTRLDVKLPFAYEQEHYFAEAGLLSCTRGNIYMIVGASKGGVCRIFKGDKECFADYGYRVKLDEGKVAATNWQSADYQIEYEACRIKISGHMNMVKQKTATPFMLFGLRVISAVVGNRIIGMLKRLIILVDKKTDIRFERMIFLQKDKIVIDDVISSQDKICLECADSFSLRHAASGKFFSLSDIGCHSRKQYPDINNIRIQRVFYFDSEQMEEKVIP
ncbi:MAG: hypothetical protein NC231_02735 [Bacillus sp. (in: Bacteria)]|nr:hypothetical protein [Bacillus sp. (in: firmicutes)]MCM1425331.1 hypothetical protein [Eubacterium sp.]